MVEKIKRFEKVIKQNKNVMLQITVLYYMSCHDNYIRLNDEEKEKLLGFLYTLYLFDQTNIDLDLFSDYVMDNYKKVLSGEITKQNIYDYLNTQH